MKPLIRALSVLISLLFVPALAVGQVAADQLYYAEPNPIPANSYGATVQVVGNYPTTPRGICFYTGYGSTTPLTGTAGTYNGNSTYNITVPASTIQQIPPASFSSGVFQAKIYLVGNTTTACNGTANTTYSNQITLPIQAPTLTSVDITTLPQHNTNFSTVSAPTEIYAHGSGFAGAPGGTAVFTYGTSQIVPQITYNSSASLGIAAPIVPAGVTSLTLQICNNGPTYNFCTAATPISVKALETNNGTLTATLNGQGTYNLLATFGASAGDTAGIPVGTVSFADGSTSLGSTTPSVTQQTLVPAAVKGTWSSDGDSALTSYVADFDKDGLPDVLVFDASTPTVVHLMLGANNRGDLNSDSTISLGNSSGCYSFSGLAVADFNGDGYPDIAVVCPSSYYYSSVYVFINNGDGTFTSSYLQPLSAGTTIAAADINKDGKPDIVLGGALSTSGSAYGFTILFGDGTGNFPTSSQITTSVNGFTSLIAGDLNNDGYPDLVVSTGGASSYIYVFQNASGTFNAAPTQSIVTGSSTPAQMFLQTVAGINYPNLIFTSTTSSGAGFYGTENNRSSTAGFLPGYYVYNVSNMKTATLGDFNADGTQDVATYDGTQIAIYDLAKNGVFGSISGPNFTYAASGIALAGSGDFNADGYADLLTVTNALQGTDFAQSYINSGTVAATLSNVSFGTGTHPLTATSPGTVAYAPGTGSYTLVVAPPAVSASLSVAPASPAVYSPTTGETLTATITGAGAAAGGTVVFMDGSSTLGSMSTTLVNSGTSTASLPVTLSAGTHALAITFTGTAGSTASTTAQSYVVQKGTPVLSWTPNTASITYGTPLSSAQLDATATLNGVTIPGVFTYTPSLGSLLHAGANQTLQVSFVPGDTTDYNSPITATTTITVTKATPQLNWPAPAGITYGTLLSGTQLDAQAISPAADGGTVAGTYVYTPAAGALLTAGTQPLSVTFTPNDTTDYNVATAPNSIVVAQAVPVITWATPAVISAGTALSSTQLNASATGVGGANLPGNYTYNPPAGTVLTPGSTQLNVSFVPTDTTDYTSAGKSVTQVVSSSATQMTLTSSANPSTYGQSITLTATVSGLGGPVVVVNAAVRRNASPTGMVNFMDGSTLLGSSTLAGGTASLPVALNAGNHTLTAVYQGDINFTGSASSPYGQVVNQALTIITWPQPASIVYGAALGSTQLNASAATASGTKIPGTFVYSPAAGAVLTAGTQKLSVAFQPTDAVDYTTGTGQTVVAVTQATPSIVWPVPAGIVAGTPLSGTQLDATAVGVGGVNLPGTFTYTPPAGTVLPTGNNTLNVIFAPADAVDYKSAPGSVALAVGLANTSTALASSLNPSTFGQSITLTATVTSNYTGASITGSVNFMDGQNLLGNVLLTNGVAPFSTSSLTAGTHNLTASYTGNTSYGVSTSSPYSESVTQAVPSINWPAPAAIVYGTALSGTQLDAAATNAAGAAVPGTFVYTPAAGTVLGAGTQKLSVSFQPTDSVDYSTVTGQTQLVVAQATPVIVWPAPASITAGTPLSGTQLDATATGVGGVNLPGAFTYTPAAGTVLPTGNSTLNVAFTPADSTDYKSATGSVPISVGLAPTATAIASSLNPSAFGQSVTFTATVTSSYTGGSLSGNVSFMDGQSLLGTGVLANGVASYTTSTLTAGPHTITASYAGTTTYGVSTSVGLSQVVSAGSATLTFPQPAAIVYGTPLSSTQLNATLTPPNGVTEPGTLTYTPAAGTILGAGTQTLSVTFTPTDTADFKAVTASTTITVNKATPTLAWATPASVVAGTVLSTTQLNAAASGIAGSLPGAYVYTPAAGTVLTAGQKTLSVTFTPNDTADYNTATASVALNVIGVTLTSLSNPTALLGDPATTITLTGTGFVSNSVVSVDGSAVPATYVNGTTLTAVVPASVFTTVHTAVVLVSDPTQGQTTNSLTIAISPAPLSATLTGPTTTTVGAQPTVNFTLTNPYPVPLTATFTLTFAPAAGLPVDPTVLFANGTSTYSIVIPAGTAATSAIPFQSGSVAGTISLASTFAAGGVTIVPTAGAQTLTIAEPPAVPGITSISITRTNTVLTVTLQGYANTRDIDQINFHFTPSPGNSLSTDNITLSGAGLFAPYYASTLSQAYGSTFTYTQDFNLDASAGVVGQVQVTLVNAIGSSAPGTAQ